MASMKEATIEKYLVERVEALGGITAKMTVEGRRGWPDRLVIMPGGHVSLVEVKRPRGGVISATQQQMFAKLSALGVNVVWLNSLDNVDRFVNALTMTFKGRQWRPSQRTEEEASDD